MKRWTVENGEELSKLFKKKAAKCLKTNKLNHAIAFIQSAAWINYSFYFGYCDNELEEILYHISNNITKCKFVKKTDTSFVFIDSFSKDTQGLTTQYLDAIIASGFGVLYLTQHYLPEESPLLAKIKYYSKAKVINIPSKIRGFTKSQWIYDTIVNYGADRILMHLAPDSAAECVALYALPCEVKRFQINLTDHTFWLGKGCSDFTFEFRQQGCSISKFYRGFKDEQVLYLPFYPTNNNVPFQGFPEIVNGKVIIFSGGSYYKVIDKDNTFFNICERILSLNNNAVILFATDDKSGAIRDIVNQYEYDGRFVLLPFRKDIGACFQNIDIFLNTYPFGGGLMCQYAAQNAVPILNYKNASIEECVNQIGNVNFTSFSIEDLLEESRKLCQDSTYRRIKGREINKCVIDKNGFDSYFLQAIEKELSPNGVLFHPVLPELNQVSKVDSLNLSNEFNVNIIRKLGLINSLKYIPRIFFHEIAYFIHL